jgi:SAM-dependent methyltransferase
VGVTLYDAGPQDATWERRRTSFERTAEAYDRYRPRYPDALFVALREYADLAPEDDRILEIGCGPGIATAELARWPNRVLALEPAAAMADVARSKLTDFTNVEVLTTSFEDWDLAPNAFGLIVCAQSFHWLDHGTRYQRIADALYAHGTIGLISNTQVVPSGYDFWHRVQDVYLEHAPEIAHKGEFRSDVDDRWLEEIRNTGLFEDVEARRFPWVWTLGRDDYMGKLGTHSNHAALPVDARAALYESIASLIDTEYAGKVTEHYVAELNLGRKR